MKTFNRAFSRCIGMLLVCALLAPSMAIAKPLTPETVHARLLKRGVGYWACVQLQNGTAFCGRTVNIGDKSFDMQLHNDPALTTVKYSDVVDLHMGLTRKGFWILTGVGFAAVTILAVVGFHEVNKNKTQLPTTPTTPVFP